MTGDRFVDRFADARSARLSTVAADGRPHIVPIVFVCVSGHIYSAVDHKPKKSTDLKRLRNIVANPRVSVLVDHYDDDWSSLWWARIDGAARVLESGPTFVRALDLLVDKYEQYGDLRPSGPVIDIEIERITGWSAT